MHSPIARRLMAAARLTEWAHRRIHGPKYAPGDVVEVPSFEDGSIQVILQSKSNEKWAVGSIDCTPPHLYCFDDEQAESDIIRVVRYGEGE